MRRTGVVVAVIGLVGGVGPAMAEVATITVDGTVDSYATGYIDLFGVRAKTLAGAPFEEAYTFDFTKGAKSATGGNEFIEGEGAQSPGSVVVTVGGHVLDIDGSRHSYLGYAITTAGYPPVSTDNVSAVAETDTGTLFTYAGLDIEDSVQHFLANGGLAQSGSFTFTPADNAFAYVVGEKDCGSNNCPTDQLGGHISRITFALGAPEPDAWLLMLIGIGGVGAALRRRGAVRSAASLH